MKEKIMIKLRKYFESINPENVIDYDIMWLHKNWRVKNEKIIHAENFYRFYTFIYVHKFVWVYSNQ